MTQPPFRRTWLVGLCIALLTLVGCTAKIDVTFYKGEAWDAVQSINFAAGEMWGGEAATDTQIEQTINQWRAAGVEVEWRKEHPADGSTTYIIEEKGQGYDTLLATVFNEGTTIYEDAEGQIHFEWHGGSGGLVTQEVRLTGGRIVSSNADQVQGGTAIWYNPTSIEAVLTPSSRLNLGSTLLIVGIVGVVLLALLAAVAVILILARRKQAAPVPVPAAAPPQEEPPATRRCIHCGGEIRAQARFCSHCGRSQI